MQLEMKMVDDVDNGTISNNCTATIIFDYHKAVFAQAFLVPNNEAEL
jgi:hypothetical protein